MDKVYFHCDTYPTSLYQENGTKHWTFTSKNDFLKYKNIDSKSFDSHFTAALNLNF